MARETIRDWVRSLERREPTEQWTMLCWLAGREIAIDEDELNGAVRRAELLLAAGGDPHRPLDPFGSSVWLRWPDIGLTITRQDDGSLTVGRFRGDRYYVTGIPDRLDRGNPWPWVGWWKRDGGAWGP